jgi:hypothetical protein
VTVNYTIASNASTGNQTLTLANRFGTSNGVNFNIYDPTPFISNMTTPWPTGQTTFVTITGSGFGTNPSISLSDQSVTISSLTVSDTQITFYATVPASDTNTAETATVTSHGYNGQGWMPGGPQGSQEPQTAQSTTPVTTTENVQISSVQVAPTSISANSTQATVTVQVWHGPAGNLKGPTVTLSISTYAGYPPNNGVTFLGLTTKSVDLSGEQAGSAPYTFTVAWNGGVSIAGGGGTCPPATWTTTITNGSACVVIAGSLSNASPSTPPTGVVIMQPTGNNGTANLNTTQ